jgi:deoxyribonuclease V
MNLETIHPWVKTIEEAREIQEQLRYQVITEDQLKQVNYVAGVDVGFKQNYTITKAAVAVLSYPDLTLVEQAIATIPTTFPYIPGFLSFREIPAIIEALKQLKITPDLILCDGQGLAHPLRFGIASHLGVLIDVPTIGVAKSLLIGKYEEVPPEKGSWKPLIDRGETIGVVLRSRTSLRTRTRTASETSASKTSSPRYQVKPIYISVGHRISLATAINYVMGCITKYRLPETTRWADRLASS